MACVEIATNKAVHKGDFNHRFVGCRTVLFFPLPGVYQKVTSADAVRIYNSALQENREAREGKPKRPEPWLVRMVPGGYGDDYAKDMPDPSGPGAEAFYQELGLEKPVPKK